MEDIPSSSKKKRSDKVKTYQRKGKRNRRRTKEEREERKRYRKEKRFVKDRSKRDLKNTKCYRCGKFGHIAPNCKKKKLKTLALELDDKYKDQLLKVIDETSVEEYDSSSSDVYNSDDSVQLLDFDNSDSDT
ncbi:hypothetical protein HAX54_038619, partial [Datura stramonium]|nr:hypothetical protein [Datura stramonium]